MARYGLDASIVLAWLLDEGLPLVDNFWAQLAPTDELTGAALLRPECTSVIRASVSTGRIRLEEARTLVRELIALPLRVCDSLEQFSRALDLADRFGRIKAYDMQYLAVAQIEDATLVTVDGGLRQAAIELGHPVTFLR